MRHILIYYSQRMPVALSASPFAASLAALRSAGTPLYDLTSANPPACFDEYPHDAIQKTYAALSDFRYQPDPFGTSSARAAIVAYYAARKIAIGPQQLLLTASTSEAYSMLFKLLCNPGDELLVPSPSYPLFEHLAHLDAVQTRTYLLRYDGSWHIDFVSLENNISARTRAVVLVNPNNPTGTCLGPDEHERLVSFCRKHHLPLICDEVFSDYLLYPRTGAVRSLALTTETLCFVVNGLSKSAGMPQMKLAWIVIAGPEADCAEARERLELLSDTYLSVSTPVQNALPQLLQIGEFCQNMIRARLLENLQQIDRSFQGSAASRLHLDGGWSAILQLPATLSEEQWITILLEQEQVLVQPGYFFDLAGGAYLVVSLLTPPPTLCHGLHRLLAHLVRHS